MKRNKTKKTAGVLDNVMKEYQKRITARRAMNVYEMKMNNMYIPVSWKKQDTKHLTAVAWTKIWRRSQVLFHGLNNSKKQKKIPA